MFVGTTLTVIIWTLFI